MLLIPGILASKFVPQGDFESIATVTVGSGGASTITFSSIPATYQHLQIRIFAKATASAYLRGRLNGSSTGYANHYLDGNGVSATSGADINNTWFFVYGTVANTTSGVFAAGIMDILDYANTNKNTTIKTLNGVDYNGGGNAAINSGFWNNTSAVNEIVFDLNTGNFAQHSHFALYGIKG